MNETFLPRDTKLSEKVDAAIIDAAARIIEKKFSRGEEISSPKTVIEYLSLALSQKEQEVFACLFLDNRHRIIAYEELFFGTINGATVHPREIVKRGLALNCAAIIIAHNHPSGVAEPSRSDTAITEKISSALSLVDISLLDHIVVGSPSQYVSFSDRGLL